MSTPSSNAVELFAAWSQLADFAEGTALPDAVMNQVVGALDLLRDHALATSPATFAGVARILAYHESESLGSDMESRFRRQIGDAVVRVASLAEVEKRDRDNRRADRSARSTSAKTA